MNYPSIRIEGAILSPDILDRIEELPGQKPADFGLDSSARVKDEIARAWADAQDYWRIFQRKLEALKSDSPATTETRQQWVVPLLGLLGYQLEYQARGVELNGKSYAISHRAVNRAQAPVHIVGYREPAGLDRKPERSNVRMSAHAVVQELINLNEQLYGMITNGRVLRLLRDSSRLIKQSYLEFDLDRIFTDGLFADFASLYRLLHATRLPQTNESAVASLIEHYHQDAIEQGSRIRDDLRQAVTEALEILGTGFVAHRNNHALREQIHTGALTSHVFFSYLLRLIYRELFLNVIEERGLVFPRGTPTPRLRTYSDCYSLQRLRRLARTRSLHDERHHDAWLALLSTFRIFERNEQASKLGTTALGGQLFDPDGLGPLNTCYLSNAAFFQALDRLCSFHDPRSGQRLPVNFGALATEEFGSVYESLLELHPVIEATPTPRFRFMQVAGNERKTSGSYYTPASLVDCLLDHTLNPVLDERIQDYKSLGYPSAEIAILSLKVCDPACGSGHFLIAAAQRMARRLALVRSKDDEPSPDQLRHALRQVIGHCIYAVDINPMSVELCRVALWLEGVEPGKPLSFLDHHIRVGNSLLGTTPDLITNGLPDAAFNVIEGDDRRACSVLKKRNKAERTGVAPLFAQQDADTQAKLHLAAAALESLPDDRPEDIRAKELAFRNYEGTEEYRHKKMLADGWCSAFVIRKDIREPGRESTARGLTQGHINNLAAGKPLSSELATEIERLTRQYQFFHWHLAFPEVFARKGFDCVLGNPPWERVKLQEQEFFASRSEAIAEAPTAVARKRLISALQETDPDLWTEWCTASREAEGQSHFVRDSGRYPLCGKGDVNTYALFAEHNRDALGPRGRAGFIVPTGIATDDTTKEYFGDLVSRRSLAAFYGFENEAKLFKGIDHRVNFCLLVLSGPEIAAPSFSAFVREPSILRDPGRVYQLTEGDIAALNPNTRTCPVFRTRRDADLNLSMYQHSGVLWREDDPNGNPWDLRFLSMFHMASDSALFCKRTRLQAYGQRGGAAQLEGPEGAYLPLFEAKMVYQFNHRFGDFALLDPGEREHILPQVAEAQLSDPYYVTSPRYWVEEKEVDSRISHIWTAGWFLGWRDVTDPRSSVRTVVACVIPRSGVSGKFPLCLSTRRDLAMLYANLCSFALDYAARQKVGGVSLSMFIMKQLPVLSPAVYESIAPWSLGRTSLQEWLLPRVLELTYTAWDLEPFAKDCGWSGAPFRWDDTRRFLLRCELDAAFFHLYLPADATGAWRRLDSERVDRYVRLKDSFPSPRDAVCHIMDTFPIVRRKDEEKWGEYRTKRVVLEAYDALAACIHDGHTYQTVLTPPPADPRCCHPTKSRNDGNL